VKQAAQALCDGSIWIFTSSQAVNNWRQLMGEARGPWPQGRAIATHDRIAQALSAAGMGVVARSRPNLDALLVSLESMP
jgi:uroporphyrinogen-III synthase